MKTTLLGDFVPSAEEREALRKKDIAEWPERIVKQLTPAQRKVVRRLLLRKNEPKKKRGGQLKWDKARYTRLVDLYTDAREKHQLGYAESVELLALIENIGFKKIEIRLAQARKLGFTLPQIRKKVIRGG